SDPPVPEEEWREVYSILVQVWKVGQFSSWRTEEQTAGLLLSPKDFWISLREPQAGDWPTLTARPWIDPAIVTLKDLPEPTAGKQAIALWKSRQDQLKQMRQELQKTRETRGFDAM